MIWFDCCFFSWRFCFWIVCRFSCWGVIIWSGWSIEIGCVDWEEVIVLIVEVEVLEDICGIEFIIIFCLLDMIMFWEIGINCLVVVLYIRVGICWIGREFIGRIWGIVVWFGCCVVVDDEEDEEEGDEEIGLGWIVKVCGVGGLLLLLLLLFFFEGVDVILEILSICGWIWIVCGCCCCVGWVGILIVLVLDIVWVLFLVVCFFLLVVVLIGWVFWSIWKFWRFCSWMVCIVVVVWLFDIGSWIKFGICWYCDWSWIVWIDLGLFCIFFKFIKFFFKFIIFFVKFVNFMFGITLFVGSFWVRINWLFGVVSIVCCLLENKVCFVLFLDGDVGMMMVDLFWLFMLIVG